MSIRKLLHIEAPRSKLLLLVCTLFIGAVILGACNTPAAPATPPAVAETEQTPSATATPLVEATPTAEQPVSLIDQLIFEREIPQLTQEEMAKIVGKSLRLRYNGVLFPLGYVGMSGDVAAYYGVLIDFEKAANQVNGNDWWRVILITEVQKSELGGKDEGQYILMPVYFLGKKGVMWSYEHATNGSIKFESSSSISGDVVAEKFAEAIQKYGTFQIRVDVHYRMRPESLEYVRGTTRWELVKDLALESSLASDITEAYTMAIIKKDYATLTEIMQNNPPKFLLVSLIVP